MIGLTPGQIVTAMKVRLDSDPVLAALGVLDSEVSPLDDSEGIGIFVLNEEDQPRDRQGTAVFKRTTSVAVEIYRKGVTSAALEVNIVDTVGRVRSALLDDEAWVNLWEESPPCSMSLSRYDDGGANWALALITLSLVHSVTYWTC